MINSQNDNFGSVFIKNREILNIISEDSINMAGQTSNCQFHKNHEKYTKSNSHGDSPEIVAKAQCCQIDNLNYCSLDPISIIPSHKKERQVLNLQQTFTFPTNFGKHINSAIKEVCTQTSGTLLSNLISPKHTKNYRRIRHRINNRNLSFTNVERPISKDEIIEFNLNKQAEEIIEPFILPPRDNANNPQIELLRKLLPPQPLRKMENKTKCSTPTIVTTTPRPKSRKLNLKTFRKRKIKTPDTNDWSDKTEVSEIKSTCESNSNETYNTTYEISLSEVIDKLNDGSWETSLQGLQDLLFIAPRIDWNQNDRDILNVNRKLIDLFRSPRSVVCRSACQVAGEFFRIVKCTKRPEFDDIVDILLCKTADSNRFIQKDANVALDKMVTFIPAFHAVRALCSKGPSHKSPLVRTATARLLVCICAITGIENILGINSNPHTRKRLLSCLIKLLMDKNQETRKFGERMARMLKSHKYFEEYFYKDVELNVKIQLKKIMQVLDTKFYKS